jgi:hypothetical protein
MSKSTGLGMSVALDDSGGTARTISNDVTSFQWATPRGVQDITGVDKSAMERQLLLADFSGTLTGVFNPTATTSSHAVLSTVCTSSAQRTLTLATVSTPTATLANEVIVTDYQLQRNDAGELVWTAPFSLANGAVPTWT